MSDFAIQRAQEDAKLVRDYGIRTRKDVKQIARVFGFAEYDFSPSAMSFRDKLFCAAARHHGASVCEGCSQLTIDTEINTYFGNAPMLCDECDHNIYKAVCGLPDWVKDRDLDYVIPALVKAFVATAKEKQ